MPTFLETRQAAVAWMFERCDQADWWNWPVLTALNVQDPATLNLPQKDAVAIFADLIHRGLLVQTYDNQGGPAFAINPTKHDEWRAIISPKWTQFWTGLSWVWQNLLSAIIGAIIGALLTVLLGG